MAELVYIPENNLLNAPSINLLNPFSMFNDDFTWNVVSGTATALNVAGLQLEGERCLRITPSFGVDTVVNSGGSQNQITVTEDGNYIFSIKHRPGYSSAGANTEIAVMVYINAVATDYIFYGDYDNNSVYRTYYQVIPLLAGDTFDFAFGFDDNDIGGTRKNYFDCFKLEIDSYGLGLPTVFSLPQPIVIDLTTAIDIPSIASNDFQLVTIAMTGAIVGDLVTMVAPVTVNDLEITLDCYVSDTDEITVKAGNFSGGAINPSSGDFTFKIVR